MKSQCIQIFGNCWPKGKTLDNKQRSIICTYVAENFRTSRIRISTRFSICRYFNRDKEIGAWSRLAESIKESITAERRGGRKRESRDVPLTLWNLSEFFSSPGYYNIAFLYLHRDATNIRRGVGPLRRSFPLEIGSFSRTLLVAHRWNTANVNIDCLFSIVPVAESRN